MLDILIRNGDVVDGSGAPRRRADVAISGGRIVDIGMLAGAEAEMALDASGQVVTPGFIDMHSHADFSLPALPTADSLVVQGITTVVVGQCGLSPVPLFDDTREMVIGALTEPGASLPWGAWTTFASYLEYLRAVGVSLNVVPLVGQGVVRGGVMGFAPGPADPAQLARMQAQVARAMDSGAIGLSTGLVYPPGSFCQTEELIAVTRPVGERGGIYFSHIRGEDETLLEAIAEAILIGRESGAAVQISHLKAAGESNWPKSEQALALIDQARAEGLDVTADMYPYEGNSTTLTVVVPDWAHQGGMAVLLQRLADPESRERMRTDPHARRMTRMVGWDKVLISDSPRRPEYQGKSTHSLAATAAQAGPVRDGYTPYDWVLDALLETECNLGLTAFTISEENIKRQLRHEAVMIGSDGAGMATTGLLAGGLPHPRNFGTFPRVLRRYVREHPVLTLEEAIWKMSGFAARKLGWTDRGLVRKGFQADLVVLDPSTVADQATYAAPHAYPIGIPHVIVNGRLVVRDGVHTQARPGRVL
jgi:N-acyl-D-amino-acid deacylase